MKKAFPSSNQRVMVSLSGGIDSTALFHLLWRLNQPRIIFSLGIFHVHYGLRGEASEADFRFVEALAAEFGVPFVPRIVTPDERAARKRESLQEWARTLRQREYAKLAEAGWVIALAHQADDLAENVVLRLARGASPGHLLGMEECRPPFWRPLLDWKKNHLRAFLLSHGLPHRHDASNDEDVYTRNVIRHRVLPELESLFPGASGRLVQCASEAAESARWLDAKLAADLGSPMSAAKLAALPDGLARHALASLICADQTHRQLSRRFLDGIVACLRGDQRSGVWELPEKGRLVFADGSLSVHNESPFGGVPKGARQIQHRKALARPEPSLVLEPGSHAFIRGTQRLSPL